MPMSGPHWIDETLEALVAEHLPALRGYLASLGAHGDLVDDLAQDVFLEALRDSSRYDQTRPFRSWLFGIARNLVRQELRKHRLAARVRCGPVAEYLLQRRAEETGDEGDRQLERAAALEALRHCLGALADRSRRLIALRFGERHTSGRIAEILTMKASAVRTALMRARATLRRCIQARLGQPAG